LVDKSLWSPRSQMNHAVIVDVMEVFVPCVS